VLLLPTDAAHLPLLPPLPLPPLLLPTDACRRCCRRAEAFLDVTEYCRERGMSGAQVAEDLRRRVREETTLTCSCGVAPNKMLAKICSDLHKPDGQYVLGSTRADVTAFVATLPVRKVPGIGRVAEQTLAALGVTLCAHILPAGALLSAVTTPGLLDSVLTAGMGLGHTRHTPPAAPGAEPGRKGLSCERTFKNMSSPAQLDAMATGLVDSVCADMVGEGIEGRTVTLKLKEESFKVRTRSVTLARHSDRPDEVLRAVLKLLRAELPITARLMGVRMSSLRNKPHKKGAGGAGQAAGPLARFLVPQQQQRGAHEPPQPWPQQQQQQQWQQGQHQQRQPQPQQPQQQQPQQQQQQQQRQQQQQQPWQQPQQQQQPRQQPAGPSGSNPPHPRPSGGGSGGCGVDAAAAAPCAPRQSSWGDRGAAAWEAWGAWAPSPERAAHEEGADMDGAWAPSPVHATTREGMGALWASLEVGASAAWAPSPPGRATREGAGMDGAWGTHEEGMGGAGELSPGRATTREGALWASLEVGASAAWEPSSGRATHEGMGMGAAWVSPPEERTERRAAGGDDPGHAYDPGCSRPPAFQHQQQEQHQQHQNQQQHPHHQHHQESRPQQHQHQHHQHQHPQELRHQQHQEQQQREQQQQQERRRTAGGAAAAAAPPPAAGPSHQQTPAARATVDGHASSSAAAVAAAAAAAARSGCSGSSSRAPPWACQACTFASNHPLVLRCGVCDTLRGMEHHAAAAAAALGAPAGRRGKEPRAGGGGPSSRASGGLLSHVWGKT
jgi:hypothetical protein